jgi:glycosyltransferase involved in cell wall biosynthesis
MPLGGLDTDNRLFAKAAEMWPEPWFSHRYNSEKPMDRSHPASPQSPPSDLASPEVSIVIPARNEEANLGRCLQSLIAQTGVRFEILVVDDASADRTREIAESFPGVRVISPEPLPRGEPGANWTGKNNAVIAGAKHLRSPWLLFTDADTEHLPGSLARTLDEARNEQADLLSYSPEQVVRSFAERAVMPVIFAELAAQYPLHQGHDQHSRGVAANGQYILVRRPAYDAVGGHAAVATEILEDVALARLFRNAGKRVFFRYGGDAVRARMYCNWAQLREGWTKNLARLFPQPGFLAFRTVALWLVAWCSLAVALSAAISQHFAFLALAALWLLLYRRIHAAHFATVNNLLAIAAGLPIFAYLLLRSRKAYRNGQVFWRGRKYEVNPVHGNARARKQTPKPIPMIKNRRLGTGNGKPGTDFLWSI